MSELTKCIEQAIDGWWGTNDPRPTLPEAIALGFVAAGYHVVTEGQAVIGARVVDVVAGNYVVREGQAVKDGRVFDIEVFHYLHWQRRGWVDARLRPLTNKNQTKEKDHE